MTVTVRLPTVLRPHANGQSEVSLDGSTVSEVFDKLLAEYPGMAPNVMSDDGQLHRFVNVYVNDEDIRYLDRLETELSDGDQVAILPAVAGGV